MYPRLGTAALQLRTDFKAEFAHYRTSVAYLRCLKSEYTILPQQALNRPVISILLRRLPSGQWSQKSK